jgi:hypothetical protein
LSSWRLLASTAKASTTVLYDSTRVLHDAINIAPVGARCASSVHSPPTPPQPRPPPSPCHSSMLKFLPPILGHGREHAGVRDHFRSASSSVCQLCLDGRGRPGRRFAWGDWRGWGWEGSEVLGRGSLHRCSIEFGLELLLSLLRVTLGTNGQGYQGRGQGQVQGQAQVEGAPAKAHDDVAGINGVSEGVGLRRLR